MSRKNLKLGFYWVRYGTEWQVARLSYAGWFLTGTSVPVDSAAIDEIGDRVPGNGSVFTTYRAASMLLQVLSIAALVWAVVMACIFRK